MAFVDIGVGTAMLYGAGIGAGAGALYSGVTGGNVLNGALMGAGIGGLGGAGAAGLAGATWGGAAADMVAADVASMTASGLAPEQIAATLQSSYGMSAAEAASAAGAGSTGAGTAVQAAGAANAASKIGAAPVEAAGNVPTPPPLTPSSVPYDPMQASQEGYNLPPSPAPYDPMQASQEGYPLNPTTPQAPGLNTAPPVKTTSMFSGISNFVKEHPYLTAAGVGGAGYLLGSQGKSLTQPNYLPTYTPQSAASMGLGRTLSSNYRPIRMADGGIAALADGGSLSNQPANVNFMGNDMYPQSQIHRDYYATPTQMPTSAQQTMASYEPKTNPLTGEPTANMASGGIASGKYNLGSYSDGGRLLKGPGDGMSDNIPATIADKQPARLADGEFVVPADVVSHLGNGSTDAGAKHLYKMMDNVRKARTGRKAQGKQIKADKFLPK